MTVADRLGKYDGTGLESIGESSGVVICDPKLWCEKDNSESSGDCNDEVDEEVAE